MSESVQTSIEEINLVAAQLRYRIESTLQFHSQQNHYSRNGLDEKLQDVGAAESFPDSQPCQVTSAVASLENDFLHREVLDLKQLVEKQAQQLKNKESALKLCKDGLKQERIANDILRRESKQISADAKANERYVKCLQIEYELLRSMTTKSQEAFHLIGGESIKQTAELEKTAKMLKKQTKELDEINLGNKTLQEEVKKLNVEITRQRASAGLTYITLKKYQLEIERTKDKEERLDSRVSSLTERLDKERHINTILAQTVEVAELKASTAFEGIAAAGQQQVGLLKRMQVLGEEVILLRDQASKQKAEKNTMDRAIATDNKYETPNNLRDKSSNSNSVVTGDRAVNSDSVTVGRKDLTERNNTQNKEIAENFLTALSADEDIPNSHIEVSGGQDRENAEMDVRGSEHIDRQRKQDQDQLTKEASYNSLKRSRTAEDDQELLTEDFLRARPPDRSSPTKTGRKTAYTPPSHSSSHNSTHKNEDIKSVTAAESLDLDDERCPICHDIPYGLMVLCKVCRHGLHSACAKKGGGGTYTGKEFKCFKC